MSWITTTTDSNGEPINCLTDCKHANACMLPRLFDTIAPVLSSVDVGRDDHMATGTAQMMCSGLERVEADVTEPDSAGTASASEDEPGADAGVPGGTEEEKELDEIWNAWEDKADAKRKYNE